MFGKHDFASVDLAGAGPIEDFLAAWRVGEVIGPGRDQEEDGHVGGLRLGRLPIGEIPARIGDLNLGKFSDRRERRESAAATPR